MADRNRHIPLHQKAVIDLTEAERLSLLVFIKHQGTKNDRKPKSAYARRRCQKNQSAIIKCENRPEENVQEIDI